MLHACSFRWSHALALGTTAALILLTGSHALARPVLNVTDPGQLGIVPDNSHRFETVVPAIVQVQADRPLRLEVLPAYLSQGPDRDPSGTQRIVMVSYRGHRVSSQDGDRTLEIPMGITELEVSIQVERPTQFIRGDYTYLFSLAVVE